MNARSENSKSEKRVGFLNFSERLSLSLPSIRLVVSSIKYRVYCITKVWMCQLLCGNWRTVCVLRI
jgi:hypothetical protein